MFSNTNNETQPTQSAGIMCYSYSSTGNVFVLLGREAYSPNFKDSGTWCDFGGMSDDNETPKKTASREFFEESSALVKIDSQWSGSYTILSIIENSLNDEQYTSCIVDNRSNNHKRHTYLVRIPWQPRLPSSYEYIYEFLSGLHNVSTKYHNLRRDPNVDIRDILDAFEKMISFYKSGTITAQIHPAIKVNYIYRPSRLISNITVNPVFIEKSELKWWSIPQLNEAVRKRGFFGEGHTFRRCFVNTLSYAVNQLRDIEWDLQNQNHQS